MFWCLFYSVLSQNLYKTTLKNNCKMILQNLDNFGQIWALTYVCILNAKVFELLKVKQMLRLLLLGQSIIREI